MNEANGLFIPACIPKRILLALGNALENPLELLVGIKLNDDFSLRAPILFLNPPRETFSDESPRGRAGEFASCAIVCRTPYGWEDHTAGSAYHGAS